MASPAVRRAPLALALAFLLATSACVHVYPPQADGTAAAPAAPGGPPSQQQDQSPFKDWDEAIKDTRPIEGMLQVHLHRDNKLFLEIRPDQLDRDFGLVTHISRGLGDYGFLAAGLPANWDTELIRFRRVGDQIQLVQRNPRFTADRDSPMRQSKEINVAHSVLASFKIESEHAESQNLLIDATEFFVSDYADFAQGLRILYGNKPVNFERSRSHVSNVLGFPRNLEIDAELTFRSTEPPAFALPSVSDFRSVPVTIRYSLIELPEEPMQPRLADPRVGHFITAVYDFSLDQEVSQFRRYVNRWRLEKKDPGAAISEPVQPIVFYIDRSVPHEYRRYVREGIEGWNKAFEAAGFRNAVVAKDAPDDPEWSAEDVRYSTVRWTAGFNMGYAIGPSQVDPRTGEILNSDVLIASSWLTGWRNMWDRIAAPEQLLEQLKLAHRMHSELPPERAAHLCFLQLGRSHDLGFQYANLAALGVIEPGEPMPEEFFGDAIRDLVMHEVGHSLGLRHNFKASSGIPYDRLHDREFTRRHGVALSVMDYAPVNIAVDPARQGHYWNKEVGTYDVWAIQYAYSPVQAESADFAFAERARPLAGTPEAELPALRRIAERSSDPLHTYATDEDNWLGPYAVDPLTNARDLSDDPRRWAADRARVVERVRPKLETRLIAPGESFTRLRGAYASLMFEHFMALQPLTKTVGGLHTARDHKGAPHARPPFRPVPAAEQRATVQFLVEQAFAPGSYRPDPELLNKLAPGRWMHWGLPWLTAPLDFPVHDQVAMLQSWLLSDLLDRARIARMIDNEVRMPRGQEAYRASELFETLTAAIWTELGGGGRRPANVDSFRRNLQRSHLQELTNLVLDHRNPGQRPVPEDARSLARWELSGLSERIGQALAVGGLDTYTRAHLAESKARIDRALDASLTMPPAPR